VQAEKQEQATMAGQWFVCQGTGPNVPKFLRFNGKVRNKIMPKADCEAMIKSFYEFHKHRGAVGGESFLRVHWVAVPKTFWARRVNRWGS
jgi:hypothetical protein